MQKSFKASTDYCKRDPTECDINRNRLKTVQQRRDTMNRWNYEYLKPKANFFLWVMGNKIRKESGYVYLDQQEFFYLVNRVKQHIENEPSAELCDQTLEDEKYFINYGMKNTQGASFSDPNPKVKKYCSGLNKGDRRLSTSDPFEALTDDFTKTPSKTK